MEAQSAVLPLLHASSVTNPRFLFDHTYLVYLRDRFQRERLGTAFPVILTVGTAFKPALGELYSTKNTKFARKFAYLRSKIIKKIFWGGHPLSTLHAPGGFGASILARTALELELVPSPIC